MSSTPPTRQRYAPGNRPGGGRIFIRFVVKYAGLLAIAFALFYLWSRQNEPQATAVTPNAQVPPQQAAPPTAPTPAPPRESFENVELTTAASIQRQQLTAAKFEQRQLIATYDEVTRLLGDWGNELEAWEKGAAAPSEN